MNGKRQRLNLHRLASRLVQPQLLPPVVCQCVGSEVSSCEEDAEHHRLASDPSTFFFALYHEEIHQSAKLEHQ